MLIVEGPDGGGKTTLIKALQARFQLEVAPRVVSKDAEALVDLKEWVEENVRGLPHALIYDRHRMISEPIYGPILRKEQQPGFTSPSWMMAMSQLFYTLNPIIIYCLPPLEVVKENIAGDEDNRVVWDHIEGIYAAYAAKAAQDFVFHRRSVVFDYTMDHFEDGFGTYIASRFEHIINQWKVYR